MSLPASSQNNVPLSTTYDTTYDYLGIPPSISHLTSSLRHSTSITSSTASETSYVTGSSRSRSLPLESGSMDLLQGPASSGQKFNRDGQPAKRRGPKPDSRPAQTRRQELNRQAQRNHREKKENYVKILEDQNEQLKGKYMATVQERDALAAENQRLKELLRANGINHHQTRQASSSSLTPNFPDQSLAMSVGQGGEAMAFSGPSAGFQQPQNQLLGSQPPISPLGFPQAQGYLVSSSLSQQQQQQQDIGSHSRGRNPTSLQSQTMYGGYDTTAMNPSTNISEQQLQQLRQTSHLGQVFAYQQQHRGGSEEYQHRQQNNQ